MKLRWPALFSVTLAAASVLLFLSGGQFAATALIRSQQARQLEELSKVALRRSESAVDFGVTTLNDLAKEGAMACNAAVLQAVRLHVYQRGAVKDIRAVNGNGSVLCSAYSETLEFDQGWVTRNAMLPAKNSALRLFRVDQFFGIALGVMKDIDADSGLVAILGINGSLFDIMPAELQRYSDVTLQLSNGQTIAHSAEDGQVRARGDVLRLWATSDQYPISTVIQVETSALAQWNQEPYIPILVLSGVLGVVFGLLLIRAFVRPPNPVQDLDRAIAAGEFQPYLQPLFDLDSGAIVGAEMLARWVRPDGTVIPPGRFIELAEETGRIEAMTWQLLSSTLNGLKPILKRDKLFRLSVNIAPRQFVAPGFVEDLRRIVAEAGVATRQITLELTEREAFDNLTQAATVVADVRGYGFKVAIDDVGIGHSGLSQIQRLGADILKIDKFFVDCINRDTSAIIVVEMLVRMAAEMEMGIVAEGIETVEQVTALVACGVHCGQGYVVAPPLPLPAFLEFLEYQRIRKELAASAGHGAVAA